MLLLSFLFFFVKSDTETFLKVFNKVKDSPIQELTRSDESGLPGGHYAWTGDSHINAVSLVFKEFSILEITVEHVLFQLEGPVFVIMKGNGNIVDLVGNGINYPFIESTSTNLVIHCKSHRQVESCTFQTYVALSDNSQTAKVDYDQ